VLIALIAFIWRVINTVPQQPSLLNWLLIGLKFDMTNYFMPGGLSETLFPVMLLFPLCVIIWDLWLMFRTLVMSANSIARERNGQSWELLLLTGLSARQIVRAKWRAVIRQQWKDYALLAIMRIGAVSFLAMSFDVALTPGRPPYFSYGRYGPAVEPHITTVFGIAISIVLLSAVIIAVLTMLNLMFTAACGIVGGSLAQRTSLAMSYGVGVRLLLMIIPALLTGVPGFLVLKPDIELSGYYPDPFLSTIFLILSLIGATIVDNGSITAGLLMRFGYNFRWNSTFNDFAFFSDILRNHVMAFLTALLLTIGIGVVLTSMLLWQAEKSITRQSVD
jgi:hypothetical protein